MNWEEIIIDLNRSGLSCEKIAQRVGCGGATTIHGLKSGATKEPRYSLGARLLTLHRITEPLRQSKPLTILAMPAVRTVYRGDDRAEDERRRA